VSSVGRKPPLTICTIKKSKPFLLVHFVLEPKTAIFVLVQIANSLIKQMNILKSLNLTVSKRILLFEAALVWTFAGGMLLFRGSLMLGASSGFTWPKIIGCILGGLLFFILVFSRISRKHIERIENLMGDHHLFYQFFNSRSYLMMVGMITMGVMLRTTLIIPLSSLSLAYITMGIPLLFSSFRFYHNWVYYLPVVNSEVE